MGGPMERYQKLKLRESLNVPYRYPIVCTELGYILRQAYSQVPKSLQALILEDTLSAFRLLPQMQSKSAVSAANSLIQSAEAALPKQKRALAVKEFKNGKVSLKRRHRASIEGSGSLQLPQDVVLHLFSFLDMQSLVSAGLVSRLWYEAANDNCLWQSHYSVYFGNLDSSAKADRRIGGTVVRDGEGVAADGRFKWKDAFSKTYIGNPSRRFKFNRGYCEHCNSIVWLNNLRCPNKHPVQRSKENIVQPIRSPSQVIRYLLEGSPENYVSDSDDSDDSGMWSFG